MRGGRAAFPYPREPPRYVTWDGVLRSSLHAVGPHANLQCRRPGGLRGTESPVGDSVPRTINLDN